MRHVFFDLETGGPDPARHSVIQFAGIAVHAEKLDEVQRLEVKLDFDRYAADKEALEINSYNAATWERSQVPPWQAATTIGAFLKANADVAMTSKAGRPYRVAQLVGHNAQAFDWPFLRLLFSRSLVFLPASFRVLDTLQLALWHFEGQPKRPKDFKLATLAEWFGVQHNEAHDALVDVRATIEIAKALRRVRSVAA